MDWGLFNELLQWFAIGGLFWIVICQGLILTEHTNDLDELDFRVSPPPKHKTWHEPTRRIFDANGNVTDIGLDKSGKDR